MEKVPGKYRVWSVFMFSLAGLYILFSIVFLIGMGGISATSYVYFNSYNDQNTYNQVVIVVYLIYIMVYGFAAFTNIHGGIALRREVIRGKGVYIFYGVLNILGAVFNVSSTIIYLLNNLYGNLATLLLLLIMLTANILTAVMMFSKITRKEKTSAHSGIRGCICFLSGEYAGNDVNLLQGQRLVLGSDMTQVNLVLHHMKISPYHCMIEYDGLNGTYRVADYSVTGTFVNGGRLETGMIYPVSANSMVDLADGEIRLKLL